MTEQQNQKAKDLMPEDSAGPRPVLFKPKDNSLIDEIIKAIVLDLRGRGGIGDAWYHSVPEEKEEIVKAWRVAIGKILNE